MPAAESSALVAASSSLPSGVLSSMLPTASPELPLVKLSGSRREPVIQRAAATSSLARIRPSPSVSINLRVLESMASPATGHASATHSFWSSSPRCARSAPRVS